MYYSDNESRKKELLKEAQYLRQAAGTIAKIKKVAANFDGKMYNCKFDEAIDALTDDESRFYCHSQYSYFEIICQPKSGNYISTISLLHTYKAVKGEDNGIFDANKRINAARMIEALNNKYAQLQKEAADIERAAENLEAITGQIETLKAMINNIVDSVPYRVLNVCNLKRIY